MDESHYFKPSELLLPYAEWEEVVKAKWGGLSVEARDWCGAWFAVDMGLSPCDDDYRRAVRYGHYSGWFDHIQRTEDATQ